MLAPLTISHAACKGHAPENTLAGIRAALALGVDAIEIDVHCTADRVPVLLHDATVDRTTNSSGNVNELALAQVQALDAGGGERIPTLAEVLDLTRDACLLVIEIKQRDIESEVVEVVRRANAERSAMIWSFHAEVVSAARAIAPEIPAARLWSGVSGDRATLLDDTVRRHAQAVSVHHSAVESTLVRLARLRGLTVFTWTADMPEDQARVAAAGVAGICTNYPDVLQSTLTNAGDDAIDADGRAAAAGRSTAAG